MSNFYEIASELVRALRAESTPLSIAYAEGIEPELATLATDPNDFESRRQVTLAISFDGITLALDDGALTDATGAIRAACVAVLAS